MLNLVSESAVWALAILFASFVTSIILSSLLDLLVSLMALNFLIFIDFRYACVRSLIYKVLACVLWGLYPLGLPVFWYMLQLLLIVLLAPASTIFDE